MSVKEAAAEVARRIDVARGEAPADLVIRNANVVNVFLRNVELKDVAIVGGCIAGIYQPGEDIPAAEETDAQGKYLIPGLIDAHTHVEMAYVSPSSYAEGSAAVGNYHSGYGSA